LTKNKICLCEAAAFFLLSNIIMLLGADFPPPRGFIWITVAAAVLSCTQFLFNKWIFTRMKERKSFWMSILFFGSEGFITSVLFAVSGGGRFQVLWVWFAVITLVFAIYGTGFWAVNKFIARHIGR